MSETPQRSGSSSNKRWKPRASAEAKKLASTELDWRLAGAINDSLAPRTTRSQVVAALDFNTPEEDDNHTAVSSLTGDGDNHSTTRAGSPGKKPRHTHMILEVEPVTAMLEKYLVACPNCSCKLTIKFPTTCVASGCKVRCTNKMSCTYITIFPLSSHGGSITSLGSWQDSYSRS